MSTLIACLSTGKGTWGYVSQVIRNEKWDKIILVSNDFGKENYKPEKNVEYLILNPMQEMKGMRDMIYDNLKEKINDVEVALNIASGSGNEHMALISAILKMGLGIRFITATSSSIEEI